MQHIFYVFGFTFDVTHGIATTKRNMTLTSFDVVSTLLFYFYFFLKCLRCYMYGIAIYMFMLTIINIYIVSTGLKEKLGGSLPI